MEVFDPNNVKIYNLSAGKSLPEWLSDRKRRALQKKDVDIRRRIELIQDFNMPGVSTNVKVSPDEQFILATGKLIISGNENLKATVHPRTMILFSTTDDSCLLFLESC